MVCWSTPWWKNEKGENSEKIHYATRDVEADGLGGGANVHAE